MFSTISLKSIVFSERDSFLSTSYILADILTFLVSRRLKKKGGTSLWVSETVLYTAFSAAREDVIADLLHRYSQAYN